MWHPVNIDMVIHIMRGDLLAPKPPESKNSLVYTVISVEQDGSLDLVSKPVTFLYSIRDLVTGTIIKPEKLVSENWWYFAAK